MRVTLNGIVAADDDVEIYQWFGFAAFSPKAVRDAVASTPEGEELVLEINSGGGSVFAGSEIYSVLRSSGIHTVAEVQSLAASALDGRRYDQNEHRRDDDDAQKRMRGVLLHGVSTSHNENCVMTAS